MGKKRKKLPGTVEKIIKPLLPSQPEKAQIDIEGADDLYREIRIENTLTDEHGEEVRLKQGAQVDVSIEADTDATLKKSKSSNWIPASHTASTSSKARPLGLFWQPGHAKSATRTSSWKKLGVPDLLNPHPDGPTIRPTVHSKEAHMAGTRKVIDCRRFPAEKPCSIAIAGTEEEVLELAVLHASTVHGHQDTPELREQIRSMLQDEGATTAQAA